MNWAGKERGSRFCRGSQRARCEPGMRCNDRLCWLDITLLSGSMAAPVPLGDFHRVRNAVAQRLQAFTEQATLLGIASVDACLIKDAADYRLLLQLRYADAIVLSQDVDVNADDPANNRARSTRQACPMPASL